jgi:hypothetical protein
LQWDFVNLLIGDIASALRKQAYQQVQPGRAGSCLTLGWAVCAASFSLAQSLDPLNPLIRALGNAMLADGNFIFLNYL